MKRDSLFARWLKFNGAGLIGVGVQLATLVTLTRLAGLGYLWATACAVETAILHNFIWHERYTWADRTRSAPHLAFRRLLQFNLSNGAVSIIGNLLLMKLLVEQANLPALLSNLIAIAACSTLNFLLGEFVVFSSAPQPDHDQHLFI